MEEVYLMKKIIGYLLLAMVFAALTAGCSKQPVQEINAAKAAVDSAVAEGAEKYLSVDAKKVNEELALALAEIKTQDAKFLKDYKKAKEMLAKVSTDAEALRSGLAAKKEEEKKNAIAAGEASWVALNEVKGLLKKAPQNRPAIEKIESEIKTLEEALQDVQKLISAEDFTAALAKAAAAKNRTSAVAEEIKQIKEKKPEKKKTVKRR